MEIVVEALLIGVSRPLGDSGCESAIDKHPIAQSCWLGIEGLRGDEQADRRFHGGVEKALHHYAQDHYPSWRDELVEREVLCAPGAFGENIATHGMTEVDVCVGDIFEVGTAVVQISQARQPCWKLDYRFAQRGMATRVQTTRRTGWYYRVLQEGLLQAGDTLVLKERPHPEWSLARVQDILNRRILNVEVLQTLATLPALSPNWRRLFEKRARSGEVEDWARRLDGGQGA